ncbi:MAG: hypothetical protein OXC95_07235 [Dehalococcoidia bacterium]|nr:hypothetical protein [Dehalococcoidia bacterium]
MVYSGAVSESQCRRIASYHIVGYEMRNDVLKRIVIPVALMMVSLSISSCGSKQEHGLSEAIERPVATAGETMETVTVPTPMAVDSTPTAEATVGPWTTKVPVTSEATLPKLSLRYRGETLMGYRFRGCWQGEDGSGTQCVDKSPRDLVKDYMEVAPGDTIAVQIDPDSRPTKLLASFFTELGELKVDTTARLSLDDCELVIDKTPGIYNLRINAQWSEGGTMPDHKVSYVFGVSIPGEAELRYGCGQTLEGGDLDIVLDSLEDPNRTAPDAVNGGWCTFNKRIAQIRLILESDAVEPYVETFEVQPPSETFHLPLPDEFESESAGGPLPPGEYLRSIVAVAVDGSEKAILVGSTDLVTLGRAVQDEDLPIIFLQHEETTPSPYVTMPRHIKGYLQIDERCMHIRNSVVVWPSEFRISDDGGSITVLDADDNVVARAGEYAELNGRRIKPIEESGRQTRRKLPHNCQLIASG